MPIADFIIVPLCVRVCARASEWTHASVCVRRANVCASPSVYGRLRISHLRLKRSTGRLEELADLFIDVRLCV